MASVTGFFQLEENMRKRKWLLISLSFITVVMICAAILPRFILYLAYSPSHTNGQKLVENLPAESETLNTKGKYLIAFSKVGNFRLKNQAPYM